MMTLIPTFQRIYLILILLTFQNQLLSISNPTVDSIPVSDTIPTSDPTSNISGTSPVPLISPVSAGPNRNWNVEQVSK
jgi:hypothetical protein